MARVVPETVGVAPLKPRLWRALLRRVLNAGVAGQPRHDIKHIRLANQVSLVAAAVALLAFTDPRIWAAQSLQVISLIAVFVYAAVPFFASRGWHRLARLWLCFGSLAWIGADGVIMGTDTEQHMFRGCDGRVVHHAAA